MRDTVAVAFKLTRRAEVTVALVSGADVLRTIKAGELAAGPQSLTWDGKLAGGAFAVSGKYDLRVTAHSSVGVTSVAARVTVDRFRPRFTVPATASATLGKTSTGRLLGARRVQPDREGDGRRERRCRSRRGHG